MSERMEGRATRHRGFMGELHIVQQLADGMLDRLKANRHKGHWGNESAWWLLERCREELKELETALQEWRAGKGTRKEIALEAADAANFLAMILDVIPSSELPTPSSTEP